MPERKGRCYPCCSWTFCNDLKVIADFQGGIAYEVIIFHDSNEPKACLHEFGDCQWYKEMGGTYTLGADGTYYPDVELPEEEPHYGKYGRMCLKYLKEHRKVLYNTLLLDGELVKHLNEVDDTAKQRMELLTLPMHKRQGVNDALKVRDQMAWVGACNNIRNAAEEVALSELIYG